MKSCVRHCCRLKGTSDRKSGGLQTWTRYVVDDTCDQLATHTTLRRRRSDSTIDDCKTVHSSHSALTMTRSAHVRATKMVLGRREMHDTMLRDTLRVRKCWRLKAKFHYASWFEAGSKLVGDQLRTCFEPVCDQLRSRFDPDSVMECGFYSSVQRHTQRGVKGYPRIAVHRNSKGHFSYWYHRPW